MMQNIFGFPNPDNDNNVGQNEAAEEGTTSVFLQGQGRRTDGITCKR